MAAGLLATTKPWRVEEPVANDSHGASAKDGRRLIGLSDHLETQVWPKAANKFRGKAWNALAGLVHGKTPAGCRTLKRKQHPYPNESLEEIQQDRD